ncbi:MAG TPA: UDP-N-acetylmuramoyl-tripeptide--D-alanyl-D-alanine ligase [Gaiellaceae bacterium]|nr:UDP-N-acetylmuramoyl-tripeptide--D-alanyl-D-alanine ligase [Gaiellaceae bacterium]
MIPLPLAEVEPLGALRAESWAEEVTGVETDSRRIAEGDLFVAVNEAARDFVSHAFARGAAAALVPDDAFAALAALGGAVRARSSAQVVAVTGSVGKTSTKDMLAALCAPHARTVASEGNYNNEIGVPLTLCRLEADTEVCVVEMGMRGLGQIDWLCSFARPEIGVITSVGPVHLELVGTVERVAEAKAEILRCVRVGVVPDEPLLAPFLPDGIELRRFADEDVLAVDGNRVRLRIGGRELALEVPFTARHQARNLLAALHAYDALALPLERAQAGAAAIELSRLRGEELELPGGGLLINDCYNASPISMRAALAHLVERAAGRRSVAVLGDMAELGETAPAYHREVGEAAAELGVGQLVAIGELARGYLDGAAGVPARWAPTLEEGLAAVRETLRPGDVVLVKGSRAIGLEAVAENIV